MACRWSFNSMKWEPSYSELIKISGLIQPEEKTRIGRFLFLKDAKSGIIGRLMIRKVIQERTGVPNHLIKLGRDDKNKPILLSLGEEEDSTNNNFEDLNFNISHQGSYVVLASDPSAKRIGIDVMDIEKPGRIAETVEEYFRIMNRQFSSHEWDQIRGPVLSTSDKKKMLNFTRFWCLKESYVKAIGIGITTDLRTINFTTKTDLDYDLGKKSAFDTTLKVEGVPQTSYTFEEMFLDPSHVVAIALENRTEETIPSEKAFRDVSLDFLLENMSKFDEDDDKQEDRHNWAMTVLNKKRQ